MKQDEIDRVGEKFGILTLLERKEKTKTNGFKWLCLCECGNETIVTFSNLKQNHTKSCGCLFVKAITKHKMSRTRQYGIYKKMIGRCYNPKIKKYKNYGGRGIDVSKEWRDSFETFWRDMENGYSDELTIDRIDNDKGYSKENCRWATVKEQNNNRRGIVILEYNGERKTIREWSIELGVNEKSISFRKRKGCSDAEALRKSRIYKAKTG